MGRKKKEMTRGLLLLLLLLVLCLACGWSHGQERVGAVDATLTLLHGSAATRAPQVPTFFFADVEAHEGLQSLMTQPAASSSEEDVEEEASSTPPASDES